MKLKLLVVLFLVCAGLTFAQSNKANSTKEYPLVSIHDIQYIDSVDSKGFIPSVHTGDTVRVQGAVMVRPLVDPDSIRTPIMYYGSRWGVYIQDTSAVARQEGWGGLNVLQNDTTGVNQNTFFDAIDTTNIVEITGVVDTYGSTNELFILLDPITPVNVIGNISKRPDPIPLTLSDFSDNGAFNKAAIKYSGMYVEINNVISSDRNTSNGSFNINDNNGNNMAVYVQSRWFRTDSHKMPGSTYQPPADGTPVTSVRGIITVYNNTYEILPLYPGDISIKATPPSIANITRDQAQVKTNQPVVITAKITDADGSVKSAALNYKIGDNDRISVAMTKSAGDTTIFTGTIPGVSNDSTLVDYYISATDNDNLRGYYPSDTTNGNYFYQVLDEALTIRDVQYSPFGSGYSGYNNYYVTLSGVITSDTSDIPGFGSTSLRVYMQDGNGPWTGILLGAMGPKGADILNLKSGDNVTLNGKIVENYGVTTIDSLTSIVVNSSNNVLPDPVTLETGAIDRSSSGTVDAEQWESVLINYQDVTVTDDNADGDSGPTSNYGEIYISDGSGDTRVELQDGNHHYNNLWDAALADNPGNKTVLTGSTFTDITGILYYSYGNYKLVPRKDNDFSGFVVDVKKEITNGPVTYNLSQNYPNPFNPTTVINFSIKKESMVTLKVFNILGQEITTLVNDKKSAGKYSVNFNASSLSSGIYFYTLQAGDFYQVKKMMLVK